MLKGLSCHLVMPRGFHIEFYLFICREERAGLMHKTDVESCMDASDTGTDSAFGTWRLTACWSDTESAEEEEIRNFVHCQTESSATTSHSKKKKAFAVVESARNLSLFQNEREPPKCATLPHNVYVWLKRPVGGKTGSE